jgi:drug/metabolite transporter (DMT)-like permease
MPTPKAGSGRDGAPIGILGAASSSFAAVPERSGTAAPPGSGEVRARHVAALIVVQLAYGGYHVISKFALQEGVDRYVFCAYRDLIAVAALFLFDLARRAVLSAGGGSSSSSASASASASASPARAASAPVPRRPLVALALVGVFLNQLLFLKGLALVGVVVAGALQLCIPMFTWILAAALGVESVSFAAREGRLKLLGATLCVLGAALATFHDGGVLIEGWGDEDGGRTTRRGMSPGGESESESSPGGGFSFPAESDTHSDTSARRGALDPYVRRRKRIIGALFLLGNCACMATYLVLQQRVLARHNRPHEITRRTYALGSVFMLLAAVAEAPPWRAETRSRWAMNTSELAGAVYGGVVASGFNYTVMTWVNGAVGASVVAMFLPLQPVAGAALA